MKIKKALIPVAGKGTRFLPATKESPKEMIPILDTPMIYYVVEEAMKAGIEDIIFVTSPGKESIANFFCRNFALEKFLEDNGKLDELKKIKDISEKINVHTVIQKEQLGLGHAVKCAKNFMGQDHFAVLLGDDLIIGKNSAIGQVIDISLSNNNSPVIAVMEVDPSKISKYGIIIGKHITEKTLKIDKMVEKPKVGSVSSNLATPGRYVFGPEIFKYLEKITPGAGGEYQLTDAINLMAQEMDVYAHLFEGNRYDTGNLLGYLEAIVDFSLERADTREHMLNLMKSKLSNK